MILLFIELKNSKRYTHHGGLMLILFILYSFIKYYDHKTFEYKLCKHSPKLSNQITGFRGYSIKLDLNVFAVRISSLY